jgi:hypothetical protein
MAALMKHTRKDPSTKAMANEMLASAAIRALGGDKLPFSNKIYWYVSSQSVEPAFVAQELP